MRDSRRHAPRVDDSLRPIPREGAARPIQAADSCVRLFGDWITESTRCFRVW
jgi:hypothetical protein